MDIINEPGLIWGPEILKKITKITGKELFLIKGKHND